MQNNTQVCTQKPTWCHIPAHWKLWQHQYDNLQHHKSKFSFILLSNFSLGFKVTLPTQSDAGGKVDIWELTVFLIIREKVHMTMCLILNGYRDRAVWISRHNYVRFWFMGLDAEQSLQTKAGYMRRTVCCNFGSAARIQKYDDQLRWNNTQYCYTYCEVLWGWWWTVWTFIVNCNKFVIYV